MGTPGIGAPAFDLSDDVQFRAYCAQNFGILLDRTKDLAELTKKVPVLEQEIKDVRQEMADEKFWTNVKSFSGLVVAGLHGLAHILGIKKF